MEIPTPTNPVSWIVWLLAFVFAFVFGFLTVRQTSVQPPTERDLSVLTPAGVPHIVEEVSASQPAPGKITLAVTGYQPDGCDAPVEIAQVREGNIVTVSITRSLPADTACTMIALPYSEDIAVEGEFEPGWYTFIVNGFTLEYEVTE